MTSTAPEPPRIAAFFDLDKTVLAASSTFAIGRGFRRRGMLPPSTAARSVYAHASYMLRGADHVQMERMRELLSDLVTGWETEVVAAVVAEALEDVLIPLVYPEAAELIRWHQQFGRDVVIISSGADEVVPDTFESSLMLGTHALVVLGVPLPRVVRRIRDIRGKRYELLRGFFHGEGDEADSPAEAGQAHLHSVTLSDASKAVGLALGDLGLEKLGVQVSAIRQGQVRRAAPPPETRLSAGDVVVVLGAPEQVAAAEIRLQSG